MIVYNPKKVTVYIQYENSHRLRVHEPITIKDIQYGLYCMAYTFD